MAAKEKKEKVSTPRLYRVWRHTEGDDPSCQDRCPLIPI